MKTCNSERWSTSFVSAEFLWDYCWLAQPYSAQRGVFTETASRGNLSSLKQTIPEKRNHRPTATTAASTFSFPSPHGRGSYPSFPFADAPFPQKRGPLSLCAIKSTVSSVEGKHWCLPACLFTLSQNSNPQICWTHLVSFPNAKALFLLRFVLYSQSLSMLTGELFLRKWS